MSLQQIESDCDINANCGKNHYWTALFWYRSFMIVGYCDGRLALVKHKKKQQQQQQQPVTLKISKLTLATGYNTYLG